MVKDSDEVCFIECLFVFITFIINILIVDGSESFLDLKPWICSFVFHCVPPRLSLFRLTAAYHLSSSHDLRM